MPKRPHSGVAAPMPLFKSIPSVRQGPLPSLKAVTYLNDLVAPHILSFNGVLDGGLSAIVAGMPPRRMTLANGDRLMFWLEDPVIEPPLVPSGDNVRDGRLLPSECRERGETYGGEFSVCLARQVNDEEVVRSRQNLGRIPIMVRSSRCHLAGMSPSELVTVGEEAVECGGYFVVNGVEKIIRMIQIPKRNYPMAITRGAYTKRGPLYTDKGVSMRCVRASDSSSVTLTMHYLSDGSTTVRFAVKKQEFFLPVVILLKALLPTTDREIYERILGGDKGNTHLSDRLLLLLRGAKVYGRALLSQEAALTYLGERFRQVLPDFPPECTDAEAGQALLREYVLVHLDPEGVRDKFNLLILMLRKLYAFVAGAVWDDNADSLAHQEVLLGGTLIQIFLKEKLNEFLVGIETSIRVEERVLKSRAAALAAAEAAAIAAAEAETAAAEAEGEGGEEEEEGEDDAPVRPPRVGSSSSSSSSASSVTQSTKLRKGAAAVPFDPRDSVKWKAHVSRQGSVGKKVSYLLATGNLVSSTGLDLMQVSGYSVVADKINFIRFTTHFRSIHRGQFFTTMKTTTVRKLLPESWGFLCPVHTPDGGPCGLLNHFARPASITSLPLDHNSFEELCGMSSGGGGGEDGEDGEDGEEEKEKEEEKEGSSLLLAPLTSPLTLRASITSLLVALGMTPHPSQGTIPPSSHLPILLDGCVLGAAPPHLAHRLSRTLRTAKALAGGVSAGVEGMPMDGPEEGEEGEEGSGAGAGADASAGLPSPQQVALEKANVAGLVRAVIGGQCVYRSVGGGGGIKGEPLPPRGLPSMGRFGHVPPSMEVAFIPPPWWDTSVDAGLDPDSFEAGERMQTCTFPDAATEASSSSSASSSSTLPNKPQQSPNAPQRLVGLFPGLFLHTSPARPIRPVLQLDTGFVELLSPLEQLALDIAVTPEDAETILGGESEAGEGSSSSSSSSSLPPPPLYTHIELSPTAMLSEVAQLTPFSDMNQSPRNMYQCQMCKQTMGTPAHALTHRSDSKLHRLQNPQAPIVQNAAQSEFGFDEYPNGANACVAVLSYTGYDMEDACIINKSSFERGWGWAAVYKTYRVDVNAFKPAADAGRYLLHNTYVKGEPRVSEAKGGSSSSSSASSASASLQPTVGDLVYPDLDADGLPAVGSLLKPGAPMWVCLDASQGRHEVTRHKEGESAYVEEVRIFPSPQNSKGTPGLHTALIKLRFDRRPVVGDKFSSRHGQKGVLSYLWPSENMPFTDRGLVPDVLINPHAFPSRMTVGMLVEMMAGKVGAVTGEFQNSTPFRYSEDTRVVDKFGAALAAAGYNYYGTEVMTSGITGEPLGVDIFYGCVYYQRLRHMVKDKAQVRSIGAKNALTGQPVKGRKKGGGVRFGEMERDALLSHGAAFLLHDRLHSSSDRHIALVCKACGSLLAPFTVPQSAEEVGKGGGMGAESLALDGGGPLGRRGARRTPMCAACGTGEHCVPIQIPYVFRYLANELAAMGVKVRLTVGEGRG